VHGNGWRRLLVSQRPSSSNAHPAQMPTEPTTEPLQFDHASDASAPVDAAPTITCTSCERTIATEYYDFGGGAVCAACRDALERMLAAGAGRFAFPRAFLYGVGAAMLGAAIYYAVIAITDLEIGLVAILIGWLVGRAVRAATRGFGSRRFQVLAVALTYFSVALAYAPIAFKEAFSDAKQAKAAASDSTSTSGPAVAGASTQEPAAPTGATTAATGTKSAERETRAESEHPLRDFVLGLGALLGITLALPVIVVLGSMPSGLISALIIGFGMHQAWKMTGRVEQSVTGPFRVGGASPPDAAGVGSTA